MFVRRMSAVAYGAEAIESWNPESRSEIAVRAATCSRFPQIQSQLFREGFCTGIKSGAMLAFEWRAIEAAPDFDFCASMDWLDGLQAFFKRKHIARFPCTEIKNGFGVFGDYVGA